MRQPPTAALGRASAKLGLAALLIAAVLAPQAVTASRAGAPPAAVTDPPPVIERAWARATPAGVDVAALYFTVRNPGRQDDQIIGLRSASSARAEIHETRISAGIMQMRQLTAATVPGAGRLVLEPGGTHVMLIGLRGPLLPGDSVPLVLSFRRAGEVTVRAVVHALGSEPPSH